VLRALVERVRDGSWQQPVYLSVTVAPSYLSLCKPGLVLEGLAWRVTRDAPESAAGAASTSDPEEPALEGVTVGLYGSPDAGGAVDSSVTTGADGLFQFSPGDGCYLLSATDPDGWRPSRTREDGYVNGTAPFAQPVGQPRFSKLDQVAANLQGGALRLTAMGDSIAWNFNICGYPESFWYSKQLRTRLACLTSWSTRCAGAERPTNGRTRRSSSARRSWRFWSSRRRRCSRFPTVVSSRWLSKGLVR